MYAKNSSFRKAALLRESSGVETNSSFVGSELLPPLHFCFPTTLVPLHWLVPPALSPTHLFL
eukprot:m.308810 g.308810  ORF g.308810 m.308810 type:complete len:62 (-) comp21804_c0_seq1:22-207(-)